MHTKDFIKQIQQLGFMHRHEDGKVFILDGFEPVLSVSENEPYKIIQYFTRFSDFTYCEKEEFMHLVWQYISTPVDERENLKRYRYTLPKPFLDRTLVRSMLTGRFYFSELLKEDANYQQHFTKKEVESFPEEVRKVISVFDQEVVDE